MAYNRIISNRLENTIKLYIYHCDYNLRTIPRFVVPVFRNAIANNSFDRLVPWFWNYFSASLNLYVSFPQYKFLIRNYLINIANVPVF